MLPQIPNIIYKSLLWLKQHGYVDECLYILENYKLTVEQEEIYNYINSKDGFGCVIGKAEGKHG